MIHITKAASNALDIDIYDHPPSLPCLNPIEKIWRVIKQRMGTGVQPTSVPTLINCILVKWDGIEQSIIDDAIDSMEQRRKAVLKAKGGHIPF